MTKSLGSYDGGARFDGRRDEGAPQRAGRVVLGPRCHDCEAKDVAYSGPQLTGGFVSAARLDLLKDGQDLARRNFVDRSRAQGWKSEAHEPVELSQRRRGFPVSPLLFRQFGRHGGEGACALVGVGCKRMPQYCFGKPRLGKILISVGI